MDTSNLHEPPRKGAARLTKIRLIEGALHRCAAEVPTTKLT